MTIISSYFSRFMCANDRICTNKCTLSLFKDFIFYLAHVMHNYNLSKIDDEIQKSNEINQY